MVVLEVGAVRSRDGGRLQAVGITREIGYRWRAENGGLPLARLAESARFLSLLGRQRIPNLRARGLGVRDIAGRLAAPLRRSAGSCVGPAAR
jgi:hypothetical protein